MCYFVQYFGGGAIVRRGLWLLLLFAKLPNDDIKHYAGKESFMRKAEAAVADDHVLRGRVGEHVVKVTEATHVVHSDRDSALKTNLALIDVGCVWSSSTLLTHVIHSLSTVCSLYWL